MKAKLLLMTLLLTFPLLCQAKTKAPKKATKNYSAYVAVGSSSQVDFDSSSFTDLGFRLKLAPLIKSFTSFNGFLGELEGEVLYSLAAEHSKTGTYSGLNYKLTKTVSGIGVLLNCHLEGGKKLIKSLPEEIDARVRLGVASMSQASTVTGEINNSSTSESFLDLALGLNVGYKILDFGRAEFYYLKLGKETAHLGLGYSYDF